MFYARKKIYNLHREYDFAGTKNTSANIVFDLSKINKLKIA